jgi:phosphoserine phosphatase
MSILVVLDVDSTLIQQEVIELLADYAGVMPEVVQITERAMSGEIDFKQSLLQRVALLKGLAVENLDEVLGQIVLTPGVNELIAAVHAVGGKIAAVSGGFSQILDPLARSLGLDYWKANSLEEIDGLLTGRVTGEIVDAQAKADSLKAWCQSMDIDLDQSIAIGDGANDILMLKAAGCAIGFRPKKILREHADLIIEENSLLRVIELVKLRSS